MQGFTRSREQAWATPTGSLDRDRTLGSSSPPLRGSSAPATARELLSDGNSHPHRLGLEGLFQATVLSQDHGIEKPDRRILDIAADPLPGEPRIMVGDSLRNDVEGAQSAGWTGSGSTETARQFHPVRLRTS
ncbi:HAD-IA family hydrolase [Sinomonas atrocyanea]